MKHIAVLFLSLAASSAAFATDLSIGPGQLEGKLGEIKGESLTLTGTIDARDLAAIEKLPADVKTLDLSGVSIEGLTMPTRKYFGRTLFNPGEIPAYTFFKSGVENLVLPRGVSKICEGALAGSSIKKVSVPEGVTSIGDYAFYGCADLQEVSLPASLKAIGKGAFANCMALSAIDLSKTGITEIPERLFSGDGALISVTLPASIEKVGREAFAQSGVTKLDLSKVKEFEAYALSGMPKLTTLAINPDAEIADGLLMDNISLATLTGMPEIVPDYFAANSGLDPQEVVGAAMTLGKYSFANTFTESTRLILPSGLWYIDRGAISGLTGLEVIDVTALEGDVPEVDEFTFEGISQPDIVLFVDDDYFDNWESHPVWRLFKVTSTNQTGVDKIDTDAADGINISYRNSGIRIESGEILSDVRVFTSDGRMAYASSPAAKTHHINAETLPSGIVIVTATDEKGHKKSVSILLKP